MGDLSWVPPGVPIVRVTEGEFAALTPDPGTVYEIVSGFVREADGRLR